ncbi:glycosyltransferase family 2 protein [Parapedobacter sp. ISTM3]|uniref:glycosyltransferase family 2 protein n=1 Tax=Parapedobacter sp. ISTM3 TaxID=2800130 RepID=UPI001907B843|nr:glycosyltransferase family 2 protein [Parapedobacter sp. ISTM3]MBK1438362.1 glycosyltransferase family 2 protein [Parapedobacter sp. ISTM3]
MIQGRVSIIVPIFNSAGYLSETLDSIKAQTYKNWECICVDDGSSDSSCDILEEYAANDHRFLSVKRPNSYPKGGNACRNYGFKISTGEYIQWFDSDDIMHERMLEEKVKALDECKEINYAICRTSYFYDNDYSLQTDYDQNLDSEEIFIDFLTYRTKFFTPGPLFRKAFLEPMDLFNVTLKRHQEREFFFRIILRDHRFKIIDKAYIFRRMHELQLSQVANRSSEKVKLKYVATCLNYQNFLNSEINDPEIFAYFKRFFLKNLRGFIRELRFNHAIHSCFMLLRTILKQ